MHENTHRQFNEPRNQNQQTEGFTKEIKTFKKKQIKIWGMKNSIKEIKNELVSIGSRTDQMEERISGIKYKYKSRNDRGNRDLSIKKEKEFYENGLHQKEK